MCGVCGVSSRELRIHELEKIIGGMVASLAHRGPDGRGAVQFEIPQSRPAFRSVALGHTRLAILDLSESGRQPMCNEDGSVWVTFNGEIYNFQELRRDLEGQGHNFRSHTDTEVIVHLYEDQGVQCLTQLNGMFALALLDLRKNQLVLARDPIGVKPLYYCARPEHFIFGSEIKAILATGLYRAQVDWQAIYDYFTFLYVPCPQTAFQGVRQVVPGHYVILDLLTGDIRTERYWRAEQLHEIERAPFEELKRRLRTLLSDSVRRQLVSDVPVGIFLSGGIDSTIVAGLAREADAEVHTFTVVFQDKRFEFYNERSRAEAVARHLGTRHREIPVTRFSPMELLNLVDYFDQPFGNPTSYLMYLISKYAREHITVALCGAGGDELYAGYPRYLAVQWARRLGMVPRPLLRVGHHALGLFRDSYRTMTLRRLRQFFEGIDGDFTRQFCKWTYYLDEERKARLLSRAFHLGDRPTLSEHVLRRAIEGSLFPDLGSRLLDADVQTFLVGNVLEYTDKMSMAVALEARVPLLDHRFVEFSLNVPFRYKLNGMRSKVLLKEAFAAFFPLGLQEAPKRGFNAPLALWMAGVLDTYFQASQEPNHQSRDELGPDVGLTWREGILNWDFIQELRDQHRRGKRDNSYELFGVIMFDVWWRRYIARSLRQERLETFT